MAIVDGAGSRALDALWGQRIVLGRRNCCAWYVCGTHHAFDCHFNSDCDLCRYMPISLHPQRQPIVQLEKVQRTLHGLVSWSLERKLKLWTWLFLCRALISHRCHFHSTCLLKSLLRTCIDIRIVAKLDCATQSCFRVVILLFVTDKSPGYTLLTHSVLKHNCAFAGRYAFYCETVGYTDANSSRVVILTLQSF